MKEIFYFLQWQWRQFELWQKFWLVATMCLGAGFTSSSEQSRNIFFSIAAVVYGFFVCKWVFWDGTRNAWNSYQQEKQKVVDIMKDSGS